MKAIAAFFGLCLLGLLLVSLAGAFQARDSYNPAEYARQLAEAERIEAQLARDRALEPLDVTMAALWRVLPFAVVVGGLVYLASLGVAHVARFRHERTPDERGLLPVLAADQHTARAALAGFHTARIEDARRPMVPASLNYSPHTTYSPELDYRADATGTALAPALQPAAALPGLTDLGALGFTPSRESILLALGEGGERITVPAKALCHVALVGATGGGKSNLLRLLIPQLQAIGARVVLADPHFAPLDPESGDDWRPIAERLHMAPAVKPGEIASLLGYLTDELERRLELRNAGQPVGPPLFFAFDELPVIADSVPGALDTLGKIVREGRKVHLLAVGASQTMLVKAIGGDSTIRDNYRTAFYVGGDLKSATALLDLPQREIAEGELQTGVAYLRSASTAPARLVRVPYASNAAVYGLLTSPAPSVVTSDGGAAHFHRVGGGSGGGSGNGSGGGVATSTASGRHTAPSAEDARILALFLGGKGPAEIAEELAGGKGGRKYTEAAARVAEVLRRALAAQREA